MSKRGAQYTEAELSRLHEIELDILKEIIRICEDNQLTYFTFAGTTLGAVRHGGFIPWDDDLDIGLLREDYEKLIKLAPPALREGYFLQHFSTEKNTATYFSKVRKDGTEFVEEHTKDVKEHHGIWVDIMPFDRVPVDERERRAHRKKISFWEQLFIAKTVWKASDFHGANKKWLLTCVRTCLHILLLPIPRRVLFRKLDRVCQKYNQTDSPMVAFRGSQISECEIGDILPVQQHPFEDITVSVPHDADKVLRINYGNYMELPPVEKRVGHAPYLLKFD